MAGASKSRPQPPIDFLKEGQAKELANLKRKYKDEYRMLVQTHKDQQKQLLDQYRKRADSTHVSTTTPQIVANGGTKLTSKPSSTTTKGVPDAKIEHGPVKDAPPTSDSKMKQPLVGVEIIDLVSDDEAEPIALSTRKKPSVVTNFASGQSKSEESSLPTPTVPKYGGARDSFQNPGQGSFLHTKVDADIEMQEASQVERKSLVVKLKLRADGPKTPPRYFRQQVILDMAARTPISPFITPPPSTPRANSIARETSKSTLPEDGFKVPRLPRTPTASVSGDALSQLAQRYTSREASIASQGSTYSTFSKKSTVQSTFKRKRTTELNSDEEHDRERKIGASNDESDYTPSESPSPCAQKQKQGQNVRDKLSVPEATPAPPLNKRVKSKGGLPHMPTSSVPCTPPSTSRVGVPSPPGAPTANRVGLKSGVLSHSSPSVHAASASLANSTRIPSSFRFTSSRVRQKRAARVNAENRLKRQAEKEAIERAKTEDQIMEEIERVNEKAKDEMAAVGERMRSMSLTPGLGNRHDNDGGSVYSRNDWTKDRMNGDRYLAKLAGGVEEESSDDEPLMQVFKRRQGATVDKG